MVPGYCVFDGSREHGFRRAARVCSPPAGSTSLGKAPIACRSTVRAFMEATLDGTSEALKPEVPSSPTRARATTLSNTFVVIQSFLRAKYSSRGRANGTGPGAPIYISGVRLSSDGSGATAGSGCNRRLRSIAEQQAQSVGAVNVLLGGERQVTAECGGRVPIFPAVEATGDILGDLHNPDISLIKLAVERDRKLGAEAGAGRRRSCRGTPKMMGRCTLGSSPRADGCDRRIGNVAVDTDRVEFGAGRRKCFTIERVLIGRLRLEHHEPRVAQQSGRGIRPVLLIRCSRGVQLPKLMGTAESVDQVLLGAIRDPAIVEKPPEQAPTQAYRAHVDL